MSQSFRRIVLCVAIALTCCSWCVAASAYATAVGVDIVANGEED